MATYKDVLLLVDKVSKPLQKIVDKTKDATKETDKFKTKLENLQKKLGQVSQKMQKLNDVSQKYAQGSKRILGVLANITQAFIGLVGASGVITMGVNKVVEFGDNIDKMSKKIGMSSTSYQEWNYIMSQNGSSVDVLAMGYKTLANQMNGVKKGSKESIKTFAALGVKITDNTGKFRTQDEVFNDVVKALQKQKNETQKAILGNKLFGRSFIEMKPLLSQSAESIDALRDKAHKYGLIMSQEDVKAAVDFKDTMDTLTRFLQAQANKAIAPLLPKLQELANKFMEHKEAIKGLLKTLGEFTIKIFGLIDFLSKHQGLLKFILSIVVGLATVSLWGNIVSGITAMTAAMAAFGVTSNIALAGIPALIGLIAAALTAIVLNWDKVKAAAVNAIQFISGALDKLLEKLGFLAYLIPGLNGIKVAKNIASSHSGGGTFVRQTSNSNQVSNVYNTTNNYGNNIMPMSGSLGAITGKAQFAI